MIIDARIGSENRPLLFHGVDARRNVCSLIPRLQRGKIARQNHFH
jgi:hypothetical protein